jgi:hypothetical protein
MRRPHLLSLARVARGLPKKRPVEVEEEEGGLAVLLRQSRPPRGPGTPRRRYSPPHSAIQADKPCRGLLRRRVATRRAWAFWPKGHVKTGGGQEQLHSPGRGQFIFVNLIDCYG